MKQINYEHLNHYDFWNKLAKNIAVGFIIFSIIMFITIQKSLQLYYKQKMLIKDLTETKEELEKADKALDRISEIVGVAMCDCLTNKDDGEAVHFLRNLIRQIEAEM